jgi:hypothetical protein
VHLDCEAPPTQQGAKTQCMSREGTATLDRQTVRDHTNCHMWAPDDD